jgi:polyisoprenoid-binding protein YceI
MRRFLTIVVMLGAVGALAAQTASRFAGKWQGETATGRRVALDLAVKGSQATGTFTLVQQTVEITETKVDDKTLAFKVALEGRTPMITGELVGEQLKLVVEGVSTPVLLSRVK